MKHLLLVLFFSCVSTLGCTPSTKGDPREQAEAIQPLQRLKAEMNNLKNFVTGNQYNKNLAIFIDMDIPETRFRFFLVDLENDSILHRGLVAHGHCGRYSLGKPKFSNTPGSNCSSLGRFSIGKKYTGKFGTAYKLHGLDSTNSAAFERFIVLHAHDCVPDEETNLYLCQSEGCPTVSAQMLKTLEPYLDQSEKPVLMNIFI